MSAQHDSLTALLIAEEARQQRATTALHHADRDLLACRVVLDEARTTLAQSRTGCVPPPHTPSGLDGLWSARARWAARMQREACAEAAVLQAQADLYAAEGRQRAARDAVLQAVARIAAGRERLQSGSLMTQRSEARAREG